MPAERSDTRTRLAAFLPWLFFLATALFFCRGMFEGKILIAVNSDEIKNYMASMMYMHQWGPKIFPLWNTLVMCGHPFGVAAVGSYNILNLAAWWFDPGLTYSTVKLVAMFLNGLFFYLFLKRRYGVWPALVPAWIWMVVRMELDAGFFLIPLMLWLADLWQERGGRRYFAALTAALAVFNLNANPQYVIYTYLFLFAYLIWLDGGRGSVLRRVIRAGLPLMLAAGLTGFFWIRAIETLLLSNRSLRSEVSVLLPTHYLSWIFPNIFDIQGRSDLGFVIPRIFQTIFSWSPITRRVETFLQPAYLGLGAVISCVFYAVHSPRKERNSSAQFFFWTGVSAIGYLTFHPIIYSLVVRHLPVFQGMTGVDRIFFYIHLCGLVVMSRVFQIWLERPHELSTTFKKLAQGFLWLAGGLAAALGIIRFVVRVFREPLAHRVISSLRTKDNSSIFVGDLAAFGQKRVSEFFEFFELWTSPFNPHFWLPIGVAALFFLILYVYALRRLNLHLFRALWVMLVVADLVSVPGMVRDATAREQVFRDADAADYLRRDPEIFRVLAVEDGSFSYWQFFTVPEMNMSYGLAIPDGYQYFSYLRYLRFYEWLTLRSPGAAGGYTHPRHEFDGFLADFLNCKYLITSAHNSKLEEEPGYRRVWQNERYRIYRNLDVMPRVFAVHRAVTRTSDDAVAEYIQAHPERLRSEVILSGDAPGEVDWPQTPEAEEVRWIRYTPHEAVFEITMNSEGYAVMTDNYFPGWKAEADGRPAALERVDYTFRGIRLLRGEHRVRLVYDPVSMKIGWALSLISLLTLMVLLGRSPRSGTGGVL